MGHPARVDTAFAWIVPSRSVMRIEWEAARVVETAQGALAYRRATIPTATSVSYCRVMMAAA